MCIFVTIYLYEYDCPSEQQGRGHFYKMQSGKCRMENAGTKSSNKVNKIELSKKQTMANLNHLLVTGPCTYKL
jgi:hypothetical protein